MIRKKKILINGYFLCRQFTGIERYAHEITKRLDSLSGRDEIAIIVPFEAKNIPAYRNLKVIRKKSFFHVHLWWQMVTLQLFLLTHRQYTILDFGNVCLPLAPGIVFLHDIYCKIFPEDFKGLYDTLVRLYNCWQYRLIAKKAKRIVTVSNFSKNQIIETYRVDPGRITVIHSSSDHFKTIAADYSVFDDFPILAKPFYFSLGSLSKRKNIKWIIEYAQKNSGSLLAISGASLSTVKINDENNICPENVVFLGYLDDSKVKALMEKCKAFILPSYYEGFGLTPLEALSCGAKIIVSRAASLPEIYGGAARYIDPYNTAVNLDELLNKPVDDPRLLLEKYSYDKSAEQVYNIIKEVK